MADLASLPQRLVEQSDMWPCDYLKKPLPLDSTCSRVLLVTHVAGDDAELFCREIKESQSFAVQDRSVYYKNIDMPLYGCDCSCSRNRKEQRSGYSSAQRIGAEV